MNPRLKMRERRSLRQYHQHFGETMQTAIVAMRVISFILPVLAFLGVTTFAATHAHGSAQHYLAAAAAPVLVASRELRAKRAAIIEQMQDLTSDTGKWNARSEAGKCEAQEKWTALDAEQKSLESQIKAIEATAALSEEMRAHKVPPADQPVVDLPGAEDRSLNTREAAIKRFNDRLASPEYRTAFVDFLRNGESGLRSESRKMLRDAFEEARTYTGLNVGTGSQGGYVVPVGFQKELEQKMKAYGRMRNNCRALTTSTGNLLDWPTMDDTNNTGEFVAEAAPVSQLNPTFGQVQFSAYLASSKQVLLSVQLLQDSAFDLESELTQAFAQRLGRIMNAKYTNGNGTGVPTGLIYSIINDTTPNTVNAVGSNSNDGNGGTADNSIGSDDLDDLIAALDPAYRDDAKFMMHWQTIDYLRKLKDKYGRPLWVASLAVGVPDRIYGYPYDWNADMDTIGSKGSAHTVLFGDFSKYIIRDVGGTVVVRYNELYMPNHQVGFQAFQRTDGQRIQQAAFALLVNHASGS